jgi:hypothetical protein
MPQHNLVMLCCTPVPSGTKIVMVSSVMAAKPMFTWTSTIVGHATPQQPPSPMQQQPVSMANQPWAPAKQGRLAMLFWLAALCVCAPPQGGLVSCRDRIGYAANICMARAPCYPCRFDNCDGDPSNGCEVNLNTDAAHCGECRHPATPFNNSAAACVNGQSALGTCNTG